MSAQKNEEEVSKQSIMLRIQKKMASGMANKTTLKGLLSESHFNLLEDLYVMLKVENDKKAAKKVINYIIKLIAKLFILERNKKLNDDEITSVEAFVAKIQNIIKTVLTFWDIDSMYNSDFLISEFNVCSQLLLKVVKRHLTAKTQDKVVFVFGYMQSQERLDRLFLHPTPEIKAQTDKVTQDLNQLLDSHQI